MLNIYYEKEKRFYQFFWGATSAYMLYYLLNNKKDEYDFVILFANTGCEMEETLKFVNDVSIQFNCEIVWLERCFENGVNGGHKVVNYNNATRIENWRDRNNPFEKMVVKYGLPNPARPFTTDHLKLTPMISYLRSIGWDDNTYDTFIGIRYDEIDRISKYKNERRIIYPLIEYVKWTKKHVNFFWSQQSFKLDIKGYEGNCIGCYKKNYAKIGQIYREDSKKLEFFDYLQFRYSYYVPEERIKKTIRKLKKMPNFPLTIYREGMTIQDCVSKSLNKEIKDDSLDINIQMDLFDDESCDIFSQCGYDN